MKVEHRDLLELREAWQPSVALALSDGTTGGGDRVAAERRDRVARRLRPRAHQRPRRRLSGDETGVVLVLAAT
jgi:hypothetical protein